LDSQKILPIYFEPKLESKLLQKSPRGSRVFSYRQEDKLDMEANLHHDAMYFKSSNRVIKHFLFSKDWVQLLELLNKVCDLGLVYLSGIWVVRIKSGRRFGVSERLRQRLGELLTLYEL
jgi:hypothetical protein